MKKILILAANPRKDLDLRREIHILKSTIERSQANDRFEIEIGSAIRSKDLQELFLKHEPRIVHFCGHGTGEQGLVLEDDRGQEQFVSTIAISDLFKSFADKVECVLLNACYSEQQADAIKEHVNYSIGMSQSIRDDAAIVFARGFYQALAYGKSIQESFDLGCNAIKLQIHNETTLHCDVSGKQRKFTLNEIESFILPEYLKPQLKAKSPLTLFPEKEVLANSSFLLDLNKLVPEEIARKRYRENRQEDFWLGRNVANLEQHLSKQEYRWRQILLNKVRDYWITGVLENSLHSKVLFELDIKEHRDAVQCPFVDLQKLPFESDKSFEWLQASDIFEEMGAGRTLLILGEPGTGKTISLLKLAERLIKQVEQNSSLPIPVVLNLSSWSSKRQAISEWLVTELKGKYQVSKSLSTIWIKQEHLILLLDGLDEVDSKYQNDCVSALNKFTEIYSLTEIVICSRLQDYEALTQQLKLRSAICLQPLTSEYIDWYLEDIGKPLEGLKILLRQDEELEAFAKTPLILSIMALTYENYTSKEIFKELGAKDNKHYQLFEKYIQRMFQRKKNKKYSEKETITWLSSLAENLEKSSQTLFLIEQMQPSWLNTKKQSATYTILVSLIYASIGSLICLFLGIIFCVLNPYS
jgi:DNA polymerase III delta prime subunit